MALSTREVLLILRARDEASSVVRGFAGQIAALDAETKNAARSSMARGIALSSVGVGLAVAGAAGVAAFASTVNAAKEYDQQAAKTATQTDKVAISMQKIKDMGRDVASSVPVNFGEVQSVLYDIFSSIDTDVPGATLLLENISKAAVGGQADVEAVAKSTLAILNAFKLKVTDVTHVNDVMFQLVRKGVGTYDDFTAAIGRSIPSSVKAGQDLETLTGMLAFLTRNGLSAAQASTSAARALDALSNPKTAVNMKDFGVTLTDVHGNFLPLVDIVGQMNKALAGMSQSEKADALKKMFAGSGGTIQAMRFFNLAMNDSNGLLDTMVTDMNNAGGAAQDAYNIMANTPESQLQLLKNRWQILRTEIGDMLIPVFNKLVAVGATILKWFENLSPAVKKFIVYGLAITAVLMVVVGVVMAVVGVFITFAAMLALADISIAAILIPIGLVIAALAALIVIGILVYKNWDTIKNTTINTWNAIYKAMTPVVAYMWDKLRPVVMNIVDWFLHAWSIVGPMVEKGAQQVWQAIQYMVQTIQKHMQGLNKTFAGAGDAAKNAWKIIIDIFNIGWNYWLKPILDALLLAFQVIFPVVRDIVVIAFHAIGDVLGTFIAIIRDLIRFVIDVFTGNWSGAWNDIKQIFIDIWNGIWNTVKDLAPLIWQLIKDIFSGMLTLAENVFQWYLSFQEKILSYFADAAVWLFNVGRDIIMGLWNGQKDMYQSIGIWYLNFQSMILGYFVDAFNWLYNIGKDVINGLWNGMKSAWNDVKGWLSDLNPATWFNDINPYKGHAVKNLYNTGKDVFKGLQNGMMDGWNESTQWLQSINPSAYVNSTGVGSYGSTANGAGTGMNNGVNRNVVFEAGSVVTQEINPVKHAADLGWLIASRADA